MGHIGTVSMDSKGQFFKESSAQLLEFGWIQFGIVKVVLLYIHIHILKNSLQ